MGQEQPIQQPHSARNYHFQTNIEVKNQFKSNQGKQHEGILKLRPTPFPNCVQISNDGMLLFLENAQATLQQLLQNRLYTNRLFPLEDVEKLIESIVYTLAYLSESNIVYRDLCPQNIYYCDGSFKLLPNQLIDEYFYDKAWQNFYGLHRGSEDNQSFSYLSPQLIIALRMKEKNVQDFDILSKSNVFILGLILLQATTLLPSYECFDCSNYDIFNNIISQRLDLVEDHYNDCIARIIANMLDYDFNQRMNTKQLSIWINRELMSHRKQVKKGYQSSEQKKTLQQNKSSVVLHKSRLVIAQQAQKIHSQQGNLISNPQESPPVPTRNYSRTNVVYINGYDDYGKEEQRGGEPVKGAKNNIYLEAVPNYEVDYQVDKKIDQRHHSDIADTKLKAYNRNIYPDNRSYAKTSSKFNYQIGQKTSKYTVPNEPSYCDGSRLHRDYTNPVENVSFVPQYAPQSTFLREVANMRSKIMQSDINTENISDHSQYLRDQAGLNGKGKNQNRFYPNLSQLENVQRQTEATKRIAKHSQVGRNSRARQCFDSKQSKQSDSKCSVNDGSINRIKLQIQKSRKLIEQFRKTEGLAQ